jgi:putative tryptophan/tyrosine transport system substrate-binding protein
VVGGSCRTRGPSEGLTAAAARVAAPPAPAFTPGDIPVEPTIKFDLVVNLTTAKALGWTIPESFLLRATEVIELSWRKGCPSLLTRHRCH